MYPSEGQVPTWKEKIRHDIFASQNDGCNWVEGLPILQRIYNEGRHRMTGASPYTLMFGIPSNHIVNTLDAGANTSSSNVEMEETECIEEGNVTISQEVIQQHVTTMASLREQSKERRKKENQKMISTRLSKKPPSKYKVGDQVLVKLMKRDERVKRGGLSITAPKVVEGTIIEADQNNFRYKVDIKHVNGRLDKRWIKVEDLTSKHHSEESKKRKEVGNKKSTEKKSKLGKQQQTEKTVAHSCSVRTNFVQINNYIMESLKMYAEDEGRKANLLQQAKRRNLELHTDNEGGGDCMFHALRHQLLTHGIDVDATMIRRQIVEFLCSHPILTMSDGSTVNFSEFIYNTNGWDVYLNDLSRPGVWGDYLTLIAASNVFGLRIIVVSSIQGAEDVIINPVENNQQITEIYLGHLHEFHYVSLIPSISENNELSVGNTTLCHKCGTLEESHSCSVKTPTEAISQSTGKTSAFEIEDVDIETVVQYLRNQLLREQDSLNDTFQMENSINTVHDLKGNGVPVCVDNARIHMFISTMKKRAREYKTADTVWGKFVFIPEVDLEIFENHRDSYMDPRRSYRLNNEPFRYWLANVFDGNHTDVDNSDDTIVEMSHDIANAYDTWVDGMKSNLRLST